MLVHAASSRRTGERIYLIVTVVCATKMRIYNNLAEFGDTASTIVELHLPVLYLHGRHFESQPPESADSEPNDPSVSNDTYLKTLVNASLAGPELGWWKDEYVSPFKANFKAIGKSWIPPQLPEKLACRFPRTEDDTVSAVYTHILEPVLVAARKDPFAPKWVPLASHYHRLPVSGLKFHAELLGETYAKDPMGRLSGVRVDKLFVVSATISSNAYLSSTRKGEGVLEALKDQSTVDGRKIKSTNAYLGRNEIWAVEGSTKRTMKEIEGACKALLPIEIKNAGSLRKEIFRWLAARNVALGFDDDPKSQSDQELLTLLKQHPLAQFEEASPTDTAEASPTNPIDASKKAAQELSAVKGTLSMIGQAVRYGVHYGVDVVMLTDYECGVLIQIPEDLHPKASRGRASKKPPLSIKWDFVDRKELRLAVAALFWRACNTMKKSLQSLQDVALENDKKQQDKRSK
ncbi:hypothetical protein NM688_g6074 [Phlebia brevispora]|uniref:Uncharacterized protein n=1 Tax=Phlebia brevispora TaxID=194682 RepID=A0ACC1SKA2_9APHY|nr:hypothetical protein NM688_g6074 [Phlebia brevispora]